MSVQGLHEVLIGMGGNLGDPVVQMARAVRELTRSVEVKRVSSVYLTSPVGPQDQPDFHNLVVLGITGLEPAELHGVLMGIEAAAGREPGIRNGPRPLDLDLLGYGSHVEESSALTLPHPRLHQRRFVLEPLVEVAPGWIHPLLRLPAVTLLRDLGGDERVLRLGSLDTLAGRSATRS